MLIVSPAIVDRVVSSVRCHRDPLQEVIQAGIYQGISNRSACVSLVVAVNSEHQYNIVCKS